MAKYVYHFSEGDGDPKDLLGGKGANLAEMTRFGLPVRRVSRSPPRRAASVLPTGGDRRASRWLASRDGPRTRPSDAARRHPPARGARRIDHLPGQHYVVRLTADDGCTAQRSYSVASPPSDPLVELFAERLEDGEVSSYLADAVQVRDELDVRGPIGGWFVWRGDVPAVGFAGGSGVVPLVAMLRTPAISAGPTCCGSSSRPGRSPRCRTRPG